MSKAKRFDLGAVLGPQPVRSTVAAAPAPQQPAASPAPHAKPTDANRAPSRRGKRAVTIWMEPEAFEQLRRLSFESGRPVNDLTLEAMDGLFQSYGLARIARG
ncbi:MAG: ribbon-helix-helix domain-containing protein [Roseomonas mucosa]|nr:ribbon-helix-helix domain-containing protein [Roseomonas mucosa]